MKAAWLLAVTALLGVVLGLSCWRPNLLPIIEPLPVWQIHACTFPIEYSQGAIQYEERNIEIINLEAGRPAPSAGRCGP
jgi:hypothetical protein